MQNVVMRHRTPERRVAVAFGGMAELLICCALMIGCGDAGESFWSPEAREPPPEAAVERRIVVVDWDTIWSVGGRLKDTTLLLPHRMVAAGNLLYILDRGGPRITAIDARNGRVRWRFGREGGGPDEFRGPVELASTPSGGVVVTDPANRRIMMLSPRGRVVRRIAAPKAASFMGAVCSLADGRLILEVGSRLRAWVQINRDGELLGTIPVPWPDLRDAPVVARQVTFAPLAGHQGCFMALSMGRGFTFIDGNTRGDAHGYIEWFNLPEVRMRRLSDGVSMSYRIVGRRIAIIDAAVEGGTVAIAFEGQSEYRGHLIDHYDLHTGEYLYTYWFPEWIGHMARIGPVYYILYTHDGLPALIAVRPVSDEQSAADG